MQQHYIREGYIVEIGRDALSKTEGDSTYKSPHRVMSMTSCWGLKDLPMSQDEDGHAATGVPQVDDGSTELLAFVTSSGTSSL